MISFGDGDAGVGWWGMLGRGFGEQAGTAWDVSPYRVLVSDFMFG